jgi:two-component system copper resistance phosphate regulon response regulator CusR
MKLLIIEDDEKTRVALCQGLGSESYQVETCTDGAEGLQRALTRPFDLIILDVALPSLDGWSVIADLRARGNQTPVIMLTARDSIEHRVRGLTLGADDYLVKPFAFAELLARIKTVLRRTNPPEPEKIEIEDLRLDVRRHEVVRGTKKIDLSAKEFSMLRLLLRHQGEVLSRNYIAEQIWDVVVDSDSNVVDVNIRRLRAKVDDPFPRKLIHTIRGRGYVVR